MTYIHKYHKYLLKLKYIGGDSKLIILPEKQTDMVLYTITASTASTVSSVSSVSSLGGNSDVITSLINKEYNKVLEINKSKNKNYELGIKQLNKIPATINFKIIPNNIDDDTRIPVFKSGTFSALYELKNQINPKDMKKYILRLFDHEPIHLCNIGKIKNEYNIFLKYLIHVYYYGTLNILEVGKVKPILIDYIITKPYNTDYSNFTIHQKYTFLINNVQMLLDLRLKNCFHSDYKMSNIGWDDHLNIVLIDYDKNTIMNISESIIISVKNGDKTMTKLNIPHTFIPKYLTHPDKIYINSLPIEQFNKFSVGGLVEIILKLKLPVDLITEFKLNDSYENIFTYEKMLEKLKIYLSTN